MGIFRLVGSGISFASEYNNHRKGLQDRRNGSFNDRQDDDFDEVPTDRFQQLAVQQHLRAQGRSRASSAHGSNSSCTRDLRARSQEPRARGNSADAMNGLEDAPPPYEATNLSPPAISQRRSFQGNLAYNNGGYNNAAYSNNTYFDTPYTAAGNGTASSSRLSYSNASSSTRIDDYDRKDIKSDFPVKTAYDDGNSYNPEDELIHPSYSAGPSTRSVPSSSRYSQGIPFPVIIPQRRPGTNRRGFARAYAPVLEDCGIDQTTFLKFLKEFQKASQASPWFLAINVSAGIASFAPGMIAMAVTTGAQLGAQVGSSMHERYNTNTHLNKMNEELFKPAGLFAMIITYQPGNASSTASVSLSGMLGNKLGNFTSIGSGTASEVELPEAAPLIYFDQDVGGDDEKPLSRGKDFQKFMAGYMDRRAQSNFATNNPNSALNAPGVMPQDPQSYGRRGGRRGRRGDNGQGGKRGVRGLMQSNVLYLMIVNLPSQEELDRAQRRMRS